MSFARGLLITIALSVLAAFAGAWGGAQYIVARMHDDPPLHEVMHEKLDHLIMHQQQDLLEIWERTKVTIVFVTHAVEEAVMLSDRVVVMTAGPGRIEEDIKLELTRPRDITAIEFNQVRRDITQYLTSHVSTKVAA